MTSATISSAAKLNNSLTAPKKQSIRYTANALLFFGKIRNNILTRDYADKHLPIIDYRHKVLPQRQIQNYILPYIYIIYNLFSFIYPLSPISFATLFIC